MLDMLGGVPWRVVKMSAGIVVHRQAAYSVRSAVEAVRQSPFGTL